MNAMPKVQRTRLLFCLVSVFDIPKVARALEWDVNVLSDNFIPLICTAELDKLNLPYSLQIFNNCNKTELVQRVLSNSFYNPKAVIFCVQLCLEYNIWDAAIWKVILQRMTVKDGEGYPLKNILLSVQGNLDHMWHSEAFENAWKCVISRVLREFDDPTALATELYKVLVSCPCIASMDVKFFTQELNLAQIFENTEMTSISDESSLMLNLMEISKKQSNQRDH